MKKLIIAITLFLGAFVVRAEDTGITTSQAYVETKVSEKQSAAPANNANSVMTYDSTSDDGIGAKAIYDATESYSNQKNALMTADTANAAIQNAINNEFTCANPPKCTLWNMAGIFQQDNPTPHASGKNLLDPSFMDNSTYGTVTVNGITTNYAKILPTENGKTYTLSATLTGNSGYYYYLLGVRPDGTTNNLLLNANGDSGRCGIYLWNTNDNNSVYAHSTRDVSCYFTTKDDAVYMVYFGGSIEAAQQFAQHLTLSNYQMEEGTTATAYEPYQNLYIPENVH